MACHSGFCPYSRRISWIIANRVHQSSSSTKEKVIDWLTDLEAELTAYLSLGCGQYPQWKDALHGSMKTLRRRSEVLLLTMTLDIGEHPNSRIDPSTNIDVEASTVSGDSASTRHYSDDLLPTEDAEIYLSSASDDSSDESGSIFSANAKSDDSQSSTGAIRISLTNEVYFLLRDDEIVGPLYPLALEQMGHRTFQKLMKDLVKEYTECLMIECGEKKGNGLEEEAIMFIRSRLRQLIDRLTEEMDHSSSAMSPLLQTPDHDDYRRKFTEAYLQRANEERHGDLELPSAAGTEPSDMSDNDSDDLEGPVPEPERFALTNRLKHFLTNGQAWASLQERFKKTVTSRIPASKDLDPLLPRELGEASVVAIDDNDVDTVAEEDKTLDEQEGEVNTSARYSQALKGSWPILLSQYLIESSKVSYYQSEPIASSGHVAVGI